MPHHSSNPPASHAPASRARPIFVASHQPPILVTAQRLPVLLAAQQPSIFVTQPTALVTQQPSDTVMVPVAGGGFRAVPAARVIRASSVPAQTVSIPSVTLCNTSVTFSGTSVTVSTTSATVNPSPSNAPVLHVGSPPGVHPRRPLPGRRF